MKTEILDTPVNVIDNELEAQETKDSAFRMLADCELMLIGGGGDAVIFP